MTRLRNALLIVLPLAALTAQPASAQDAPALDPGFSSSQALTGLIVGGSLLFVLIIFGMIMRQVRRSREFAHLERLKAFELGQPAPGEEPDRPQDYGHRAFWIAFWLGAGVPIAAVSAASSTTIQGHIQELGLLLAIWICTAAVGVASVICATVLMVSARRAVGQSGPVPPDRTRREAAGSRTQPLVT